MTAPRPSRRSAAVRRSRKRANASGWLLFGVLAFLVAGALSPAPTCWRLFITSAVVALLFIGCAVEQALDSFSARPEDGDR